MKDRSPVSLFVFFLHSCYILPSISIKSRLSSKLPLIIIHIFTLTSLVQTLSRRLPLVACNSYSEKSEISVSRFVDIFFVLKLLKCDLSDIRSCHCKMDKPVEL